MSYVRRFLYWWTIPFTGLACLLTLGLVARRPPPEPSFRGKPLHEWLEGIDGVVLRATSKEIELEATNASVSALLAIGREGLPWLRHELGAHESPLKVKLRDVALRFPTLRLWLMNRLSSPTDPTLWERHRRAAMGTLLLGGAAEPLVPELATLLKSGDDCSLYSFALARMGKVGVPVLATALTNQSTQFNALHALELTAANTESAVPALLSVLTNGGGFPSIQDAFFNARGASNSILPVLRAAISSTNWMVSKSAEATLQLLSTERVERGQKDHLIRLDRYGNWSSD